VDREIQTARKPMWSWVHSSVGPIKTFGKLPAVHRLRLFPRGRQGGKKESATESSGGKLHKKMLGFCKEGGSLDCCEKNRYLSQRALDASGAGSRRQGGLQKMKGTKRTRCEQSKIARKQVGGGERGPRKKKIRGDTEKEHLRATSTAN